MGPLPTLLGLVTGLLGPPLPRGVPFRGYAAPTHTGLSVTVLQCTFDGFDVVLTLAHTAVNLSFTAEKKVSRGW